MRPASLLILALGLWAPGLLAQKSLENITVPTEPAPAGGTQASLCCTPLRLFTERDNCRHEWRHQATRNSLSLEVKTLCDYLKQTAKDVPLDSGWYVATKADPTVPLYRIDCSSNRASSLIQARSSPPPESPSAAPSPTQPAAEPADLPAAREGGVRPEAIKKLNSRLDGMEKDLKEQKGAFEGLQEDVESLRSGGQRDLERKLEALRKEILERLRALEDAQRNGCYRIDDRYKGQDEVLIAVGGGVLRFVKVKPRTTRVAIGLSEAKADDLLAEAQAQSEREIFPHVLLAVPEAVREVKPFFLQDRLIDPQLYSRLTNGKDANRVAYQDVERFIAELNARCGGRAKFVLPSEEQFVAAAHWHYDPVANGLKPCEAVRTQDLCFDVTELLGHAWQLTRSLCVPFSDPPRTTCPEGSSYIRKGGAASSLNRLECMPEYRSPAPFDVNQKETSFRLALAE